MKAIKIDQNEAIELIEVEWETIQDLWKELGGYVERVVIGDFRTRERFGTPEHSMIMLVAEDVIKKGLEYNPIASVLYGEKVHGGQIWGDALLVGEGIVMGEDGPNIDFRELPEEYDLETVKELLSDLFEAAKK